MDLDGLTAMLMRIHSGALRCVARDTPEPSVFAHEILNARPYAFLDDAPLEERRAQAVQTRRAGKPSAADLGALDASAIARVIDEARPDPRDAEELHDVLLTVGCLSDSSRPDGPGLPDSSSGAAGCASAARDARERRPGCAGRIARSGIFVAAERLPEILAVHPDATVDPGDRAAPFARRQAWTRADALRRAASRTPRNRRADDRCRARRVLCRRRPGRRGSPPGPRSRGRRPAGQLHAWQARARVVRSPAAGAHPPLHAESAARRDRAGQPRRVHAIPLRLAARRSVIDAGRNRRSARGADPARWHRASGAGVGARRAAGTRAGFRAGDARHAVPDRRGRVGASVDRPDAGRRRHPDRASFSASTPSRGWRFGPSVRRDRSSRTDVRL